MNHNEPGFLQGTIRGSAELRNSRSRLCENENIRSRRRRARNTLPFSPLANLLGLQSPTQSRIRSLRRDVSLNGLRSNSIVEDRGLMTPSILGHLDRLADGHPDKLLYSYLNVNGDSIEGYTYASFMHRTEAIAGHLWKEGRFAPGDRLLLAYAPGLEMICAFFGCVRAGLIPVPVYPPSSRGFQSALYKMVHI